MAAYNLDSIKDPRQHNSIPVFLRDLRICHAGHEKRMEGFVYEARNRYDLPRPVRFHHHPRLPFALRLSFCLRVSPLGRWTTGMGEKKKKKKSKRRKSVLDHGRRVVGKPKKRANLFFREKILGPIENVG